MNTHDKYELPTLPEPFIYTRPGKTDGALFHAGHMQDYARTAIEPYQRRIAELESQLEAIGAGGVTQGQRLTEADRQRRGEPAAWMQRSYLNQIRESNLALHNVVIRGSKLDGDGDVVPLYAAPQPADPSGVPTLHNADSGAQNGIQAMQPAEPATKEPLTVAESMIDARAAAQEQS